MLVQWVEPVSANRNTPDPPNGHVAASRNTLSESGVIRCVVRGAGCTDMAQPCYTRSSGDCNRYFVPGRREGG